MNSLVINGLKSLFAFELKREMALIRKIYSRNRILGELADAQQHSMLQSGFNWKEINNYTVIGTKKRNSKETKCTAESYAYVKHRKPRFLSDFSANWNFPFGNFTDCKGKVQNIIIHP